MVDYYKDPQYVKTVVKRLHEGEAAVALNEAWKKYYNRYPNKNQLALLWAQATLETGRFKEIRNYNFGNIKKKHANPKYKVKDDGHKFTMFATGENLWDSKKKKMVWHWFKPPHIQCHFRSYESSIFGAKDYLLFVSQKERYKTAWQKVLAGDPEGYGQELYNCGYYTASPSVYTKGVVRLTNEFLNKADELLSWSGASPPNIKPGPIFTEEEQKQLMSEIGLASGMSLEDYFIYSNNYTPDDDEDTSYYTIEQKPWWKVW